MQVAEQDLITTTHPRFMIVLTDGQENVRPFVKDVLPSLKSNSVVVMSIGLGAQASSSIAVASAETGGVFFAAGVSEQSVSNAFNQSPIETNLLSTFTLSTSSVESVLLHVVLDVISLLLDLSSL
jgi:hypothetical protein